LRQMAGFTYVNAPGWRTDHDPSWSERTLNLQRTAMTRHGPNVPGFLWSSAAGRSNVMIRKRYFASERLIRVTTASHWRSSAAG